MNRNRNRIRFEFRFRSRDGALLGRVRIRSALSEAVKRAPSSGVQRICGFPLHRMAGWAGWLAGWLAGLAGWGYRGRQWSVRLFPHPPAAARGLWVYGASSPRDQVTLSRKRDVRPADRGGIVPTEPAHHSTSAAILPCPREPPIGPSCRWVQAPSHRTAYERRRHRCPVRPARGLAK